MTTDDDEAGARLDRLNANLAKVEELSQRLMVALSRRKQADPALNGPGQDVYLKAAAAYVAEMMQNPAKILEHQISYWGKSLKHYVQAQQVLAKGKLQAPPIQRRRTGAFRTRCGKRTPSSTTSSSSICCLPKPWRMPWPVWIIWTRRIANGSSISQNKSSICSRPPISWEQTPMP